MTKISIITALYNRGYTMNRLYESLKIQSDKSFEWVIIDDGSTEDVRGLINGFQKENIIPIYYYKKENGGKHTALNYGVSKVQSELCYIVDSDDCLPEKAIERILHWYKKVEKETQIAGIGGLRENLETGEIIGSTFTGESLLCKSSERPKYGISGDKAEVFKTEILRRFPFPEFQGEKFLSESVVWNEISAANYDILWFNEVIYKGEYLSDGLTYNLMKNYKSSPQGFALYLQSLMSHEQISLLRKYYYYGMYHQVTEGITIEKVGKIFKIHQVKVRVGIFLYKLKGLRK